jgi:hypothetical protein
MDMPDGTTSRGVINSLRDVDTDEVLEGLLTVLEHYALDELVVVRLWQLWKDNPGVKDSFEHASSVRPLR